MARFASLPPFFFRGEIAETFTLYTIQRFRKTLKRVCLLLYRGLQHVSQSQVSKSISPPLARIIVSASQSSYNEIERYKALSHPVSKNNPLRGDFRGAKSSGRKPKNPLKRPRDFFLAVKNPIFSRFKC